MFKYHLTMSNAFTAETPASIYSPILDICLRHSTPDFAETRHGKAASYAIVRDLVFGFCAVNTRRMRTELIWYQYVTC